MAKKCECGHASSFHRETKKRGGLAGFADGLGSAFGGSNDATFGATKERPVCNVKGCGCLRWVEDE